MNAADADERPAAVVYHSRRWGVLVASVILTLLGLLLLAAESPAERAVGGICAALFGLGTLVLARPGKRPPALILDAGGLTDAASALAAGFVPWSEVTGVVVQRLRGQRYLSVMVSDPEAVLAGTESADRAAMWANHAQLGSPVNIPLRPMTITLADLTLELARRTPSALPSALRARLPSGAPARPAATPQALDDLSARAADASVTLPTAYLELLADQDGVVVGDLRVYGTRSSDGLEGVLEVNQTLRAGGPGEPAVVPAEGYVVLASDAVHDYCAHTADGDFRVLARSDHRFLARVSTFSDLIVAALTEFTHPFG